MPESCLNSKKQGAYAEFTGTGPEIIQVLLLFPLWPLILLGSFARLIQPDIVNIHLA
jgi:hypothetical protein